VTKPVRGHRLFGCRRTGLQACAGGNHHPPTRMLYCGFSGVGGTLSRSIGALVGHYYLPVRSLVDQPSSSLLDNRIYFADGEADLTYLLSARTSFTVGGQGFIARRQADALSGVIGYVARGSLQRRM
jgi:hypothetical protein